MARPNRDEVVLTMQRRNATLFAVVRTLSRADRAELKAYNYQNKTQEQAIEEAVRSEIRDREAIVQKWERD